MSFGTAAARPRILITAGVLLVALVVAVVILGAGGNGEGPRKAVRTVRAQLTLERAVQPETGQPELIVSLPERRLNTLETSHGATSVLLRCVDRRGAETIRQRHDWPLQEEVGFSPHVHQPAGPRVLNGVRGCRITGRGVDFTARERGRVRSVR